MEASWQRRARRDVRMHTVPSRVTLASVAVPTFGDEPLQVIVGVALERLGQPLGSVDRDQPDLHHAHGVCSWVRGRERLWVGWD